MNWYIEQWDNPKHIADREANKRIKNDLDNDAIYEEGAIRWKTNDRYVPIDIAELAAHIGYPVDIEKHKRLYQEETSRILAEYRESMKNYVPSEEEKAEMRAAFGAGATVVNVITGQQYTV